MSQSGQPLAAPYPWEALPVLGRHALEQEKAAKSAMGRLLAFERLAPTLEELFAVQLQDFGISASRSVGARESLGATAQWGNGDLSVWLTVQPTMATMLLSRVVGKPLQLQVSDELPYTLLGAWHAMADQVLSRLSREPLTPERTNQTTPGHCFEFWLRLDRISYRCRAVVSGATTPPPALSVGNCALPVRLRLVLSNAPCDPMLLRTLELGDVFFPASWTVDAELSGSGVLCAPTQERGISVTLSGQQLTVQGKATLAFEQEALEQEALEEGEALEQENDTSHDAIADAPVLVRVEVGSVTMSAREWVGLAPGDVVGTGTPMQQPVVLRVAGQQVAEGELVNIDGELGVRITKLK